MPDGHLEMINKFIDNYDSITDIDISIKYKNGNYNGFDISLILNSGAFVELGITVSK